MNKFIAMAKYIVNLLSAGSKMIAFQDTWRRANRHNLTSAGTFFPIEKVSVGNNTYGRLNVISYSNPDEKLSIGSYCSISGTTRFLLSGEHNYSHPSTFPFKRTIGSQEHEAICKGPICVDDDVWIGDSSIILSGVHIHQGAVIAAGSVVNRDCPPYAIMGGGYQLR